MTVADLAVELGAVAPFDLVASSSLEELTDALREIRLDPGEPLVTAGEEADELFVLLEGSVEIIAPAEDGPDGVVLGHLGAGDVVGEIAVLTGATRTATLRAETSVRAIGIRGERFVQLLTAEPALGARLAATASTRLRETRLTGQLQRLFPGSDGPLVADLVERVEFVVLSAGTVLFQEGDPADAAYVIVSGRVRVLVRRDDGWASPIAEVGAGELIGEMALLDDIDRTATVVAARDSVVARLPREDFESLATSHPKAMLAVTRTIVSRSRDSREVFDRAGSDHASIGLVPVTTGVDLGWLATELTRRLQQTDRAQLVTPDSLERELRISGIAQARSGEPNELRLTRWIEEAEASNDLLVLQGEGWTRRGPDGASSGSTTSCSSLT